MKKGFICDNCRAVVEKVTYCEYNRGMDEFNDWLCDDCIEFAKNDTRGGLQGVWGFHAFKKLVKSI